MTHHSSLLDSNEHPMTNSGSPKKNAKNSHSANTALTLRKEKFRMRTWPRHVSITKAPAMTKPDANPYTNGTKLKMTPSALNQFWV
jgi:hypothetical protein